MLPNDYNTFMQSLKEGQPLESWPKTLKSLWYDANGNWEASHDIAQDVHDNVGSWIHAYLHRKEGDEFNAGYWYRRANKPFPKITFKEEFREIIVFILSTLQH